MIYAFTARSPYIHGSSERVAGAENLEGYISGTETSTRIRYVSFLSVFVWKFLFSGPLNTISG